MLFTADELKMEKQRCIKRSQERGSQTQKQAGGQARATEGTVARRGLAARASPFGLPDGDRRGGCLGSPPRPPPAIDVLLPSPLHPLSLSLDLLFLSHPLSLRLACNSHPLSPLPGRSCPTGKPTFFF